ncbi:MAG: stage II sporulation protein M [Lachnospiraceae bacterium]|nr:stage II sporulation protein M [Lachnospiraceae bacterium]
MQFAGKQFLARQRNFLTCFGAGLLVGIILINIGKSILLGETGLFDEYTLYHMKYMTVDCNALFCYILRKRMGRMLILAVLSSTYLGLVVCMGAAFWYGMSAGAFLAALSLRYGLKGILLAVISLFPHYLLYMPAVLLLLVWCEELFRGIYVRGELSVQDRRFMLKKAGRLLLILAVAAAGCLLEGYLNPYLLLGFLKIF